MPITDHEAQREEQKRRDRAKHEMLCALLAQHLGNDQARFTLHNVRPYVIEQLANDVLAVSDLIHDLHEATEKRIEEEVKKRVAAERSKLRAPTAQKTPKNERPGPTKKPAAKPTPAPAASPKAAPSAKAAPGTKATDDAVLACFGSEPKAIGAAIAGTGASRGVVAGAVERLVALGELNRSGTGRGAKYTRTSVNGVPAPAPKQPALFDADDADDEGDET